MKDRLSTLLGAGAALGIAFAPVPATANSSERVDLGQQQTTIQHTRWQPIDRTESVTLPWSFVTAHDHRARFQTPTGRIQGQNIRTTIYQQQSIRYPLEAKQVQTETTTTRRYELRTYAVQTTQSTVSVTSRKEVGAWATRSTDVPVMMTLQRPLVRTVLVSEPVPVYRTVTSTYSTPVLTPLQGTKTVNQPQSVSVTKYRDVSSTRDALYSGNMYDRDSNSRLGTVTMDSDEQGLTLSCPGRLNAHMAFTFRGGSVEDGALTYSVPYSFFGGTYYLSGTCKVHWAGDHDELSFDADHRWFGTSHWWGTTIHARLDHHLIESLTTTEHVPYTETTTQMVPIKQASTYPVQLDHLTNRPKEQFGTGATSGVFWKHYHYPGIPCPYETVHTRITGYYSYWGWSIPRYDASEINAAMARATMVGGAADRIARLGPDTASGLTIAYHHTDVMPQVADDAQVITQKNQVLDHYDSRLVWQTRTVFVPIQRPVLHVVGWKPGSYSHSHNDPSIQCDDTHVAKRQYNLVLHDATPIYAPVTKRVDTQVWSTSSIPITSIQTVTSTRALLVGSVPGVETRVDTGPWLDTGGTRRGRGDVTTSTRAVDTLLATWLEPSVQGQPTVATAAQSRSSVYLSDFHTGSANKTPQKLGGATIRRLLKSSQAAVSRANRAHTLPQGSADNKLSVDEHRFVNALRRAMRAIERHATPSARVHPADKSE